jgi:hydrogenase maturation factor HypF (carbamoyltransferase family)
MTMIRLAVLPLSDAKQLQADVAKRGVEVVLNHNGQTCTRGCTVTVEILGLEKDIPIVAEVYQNNFKKLTDGHNVNWDIANSVFDPTKETAICPACSTEFSTKLSECPECGLVLG